MTTSEAATACRNGTPYSSESAGTIMTPPPIPRSAPSEPATAPMAARASATSTPDVTPTPGRYRGRAAREAGDPDPRSNLGLEPELHVVRRLAAADAPVLERRLVEHGEHAVPRHAGLLQVLDEEPVEPALRVDRAAREDRALDEHRVVPVARLEVLGRVLVHELVPVCRRKLERFDEGSVDPVEERLLLRRGPAGAQVDVHEGHAAPSVPWSRPARDAPRSDGSRARGTVRGCAP